MPSDLIEQAIRKDGTIDAANDAHPPRPWPRVRVNPACDRETQMHLCPCRNLPVRAIYSTPLRVHPRPLVSMRRQKWATRQTGDLPDILWIWVGQCGDCGTIYYATDHAYD